MSQVRIRKQTRRHSVTAQARMQGRLKKTGFLFRKPPKNFWRLEEARQFSVFWMLTNFWSCICLYQFEDAMGLDQSEWNYFSGALNSHLFFSCSNTLKFAFLWPDNLCECVMRTLRVTHTFHLRLFVGFLHGFVNLTCARSQLYWICCFALFRWMCQDRH